MVPSAVCAVVLSKNSTVTHHEFTDQACKTGRITGNEVEGVLIRDLEIKGVANGRISEAEPDHVVVEGGTFDPCERAAAYWMRKVAGRDEVAGQHLAWRDFKDRGEHAVHRIWFGINRECSGWEHEENREHPPSK